MNNPFFDQPILNSPYEYPTRHWELDSEGQPTQKILETRRRASFITPIPKPKKRKAKTAQQEMIFDEGLGLSNEKQQYDQTSMINEVRSFVDQWRRLSDNSSWGVTPQTARLLKHWRHHRFSAIRPFFCQIEAVETAIWLSEVAPSFAAGRKVLENLQAANQDANPELFRIALKLATGAGKTTVMAMLIAWQTVNAVHHENSKLFTRGFLIVAPGLTIKERLGVLLPNDANSYYSNFELVPADMLEDIKRAKIVITNYHAFRLRERTDVSKGTRAALEGWRKEELKTLETEGQMIQRVMPDLMNMKNVLVINDEAHHCYRAKVQDSDEEELTGEEKDEATKNNAKARLWISGLETVKRQLGVNRVYDLSATPFFLRGSNYAEGTLFTWTVSDFSLMDAIESGIVKLPRVPVTDNIPGQEMPMFRNLWENIRKDMPKKGRGKNAELDPLKLPTRLKTALEALYGHYEKTFKLWEDAGIKVPPCFIIVCQNTAISKLVFDYVSGFQRTNPDGTTSLENGRLALFRNFDETTGNPLPRPNTLLIDSEQLEAGDALDTNFRAMASDEIERFRRELIERTGDQHAADSITDQALLRGVMNTVGKPGRLGGSIRCVVSVAMLTEGWDTNTVTHVLGVRAFGTQLLCEQVIGRALRRQSYEINEDGPNQGLFNVEYADIFGIPFDFASKPTIAAPQPPREIIQVKAMRPERNALEIRFPRVEGYRVELPEERLEAVFNDDSKFELTPEIVGASKTQNAGIIGQVAEMSLEHLQDYRPSTIVYKVTERLLYTKFRDPGQDPPLNLFGQLKRIVKQWLDTCLDCKGGTYPAQLIDPALADIACNRIISAITRKHQDKNPIKAMLDPYNPAGSTMFVRFNTSKPDRWETAAHKCHVNWVILDSDWEAEFCRVAEAHPKVFSYVKNHGLGFEVPYQFGSENRKYRPDFIVLIDDGRGPTDLLHLVVEIKGFRREDAKEKKSTMDTYWIPGVNQLGSFGRWAFAEFRDVYTIESDFEKKLKAEFEKLIDSAVSLRVGGKEIIMAKKPTPKMSVETISHKDDKRKNIPTAEFQSVLKQEQQSPMKVHYERRNRDLDPQLVWRGKDEQDWSDLIAPAPPIYIQEKVHPKSLIDDLLRQTEESGKKDKSQGPDLFSDFNGIPEGADKTDFYHHDGHWSNRMILGDSLQVMASLAEREGLRGKVQCIYFDPPYGIKFNSNFQWSTTSRDVKDGKADNITREPEQVKAFRDTWRDGIHSYLTYLRDRLTVARDLLTESGSIFVQIGDENVHRVRAVMDEVFGEQNFISQITIQTTTGFEATYLGNMSDHVLWYGKRKEIGRANPPLFRKNFELGEGNARWLLFDDFSYRGVSAEEKRGEKSIPIGAKPYKPDNILSQGRAKEPQPFEFRGRTYDSWGKNSHWKANYPVGMLRLAKASRIHVAENSIQYVRLHTDFEASVHGNMWFDTGSGNFTDEKLYVVQTNAKVIERCILMATNPGDLVLDPTCGSGTTATVAEQWGRRWITIDTSRVALALARARIMGARYPYYILADSREGQFKEAELSGRIASSQPVHGSIRQGFVYERVPHISLKSIAKNAEIDVIWETWQQELEPLREALNKALKQKWEEWEIPREADAKWPEKAKGFHKDWWQARISRQKEIDASIAAKAEFEKLYDKPYEDKKKVRVAGPFTVESLSPHRMLGVDENDELIDPKKNLHVEHQSFEQMILENLRTAGVQQAHKEDKISFTSLAPWPGKYICAEGRYLEAEKEKRAGVFIGPEFGTVQRQDLVVAAREAGDAGFDVLISCAFNYEAHTTEFSSLGRIPVLKARMNADLHMSDELKNTGKGNLFVIFGEPDIELIPEKNGQLRIKVKGVDVFKPQTGEVVSSNTDEIACWFIDTDYNEESFFVRHAYFLGASDPYKSLKTTLKAEINEEAWESLHSDISRPFDKPKSGRIAVKVINHLGDEVMKVFGV